jgi:putative DNA primase/helicase
VAHIDKPALSFNLMIQPALMSEVAGSKGFRDSGLLARFLYAVPATNVGQRNVRSHISLDPVTRERYETVVMRLLDNWLCEPGTVPQVQVLTFTPAALEIWHDFAQHIEDKQGDGGVFESIRDWTSKLAGAVARISTLLELVTTGLHATVVDYESMHLAVRLAEALIPHAMAAFGLLGCDSTEADALAVLKWVQAHGYEEFTRHKCQKAMEGRFRSVDKLKRALDRLDAMDCTREFKRRNKGAPASVYYKVNPKLLHGVSTLSGMS